MAKLPAYITIAFDLTGALSIQQIQYREVLDVDGVLTEVKQYPPDLIVAPQANDQITATLKDAVGAIAAGHLEAVRAANAERDEAVAKFEAVNGVNVERLQQDLVSASANVQALLEQIATK
jgi:ABC-type nitrate/sulfonate/bicarbonate transport system substrate-binding protein